MEEQLLTSWSHLALFKLWQFDVVTWLTRLLSPTLTKVVRRKLLDHGVATTMATHLLRRWVVLVMPGFSISDFKIFRYSLRKPKFKFRSKLNFLCKKIKRHGKGWATLESNIEPMTPKHRGLLLCHNSLCAQYIYTCLVYIISISYKISFPSRKTWNFWNFGEPLVILLCFSLLFMHAHCLLSYTFIYFVERMVLHPISKMKKNKIIFRTLQNIELHAEMFSSLRRSHLLHPRLYSKFLEQLVQLEETPLLRHLVWSATLEHMVLLGKQLVHLSTARFQAIKS